MQSQIKLIAILAIVAAVATATTVMTLTSDVLAKSSNAGKGKAFGQCNSGFNKANKNFNGTETEKSNARKAACAALKPGHPAHIETGNQTS